MTSQYHCRAAPPSKRNIFRSMSASIMILVCCSAYPQASAQTLGIASPVGPMADIDYDRIIQDTKLSVDRIVGSALIVANEFVNTGRYNVSEDIYKSLLLFNRGQRAGIDPCLSG